MDYFFTQDVAKHNKKKLQIRRNLTCKEFDAIHSGTEADARNMQAWPFREQDMGYKAPTE